MSTQSRIVLVDDRGGALHAVAGTSPPAGPPATSARLVTLRHPKTGRPQRYGLVGGHLCELQRVSQATPCSWFVDQSVHSDGSLLLLSRVDPVFVLLPLLTGAGDAPHFSPLRQYVQARAGDGSDARFISDVAGVHAALVQVCDVHASSADDAPEDRLYRLSRPRAAAYLAAKARRLAGVLQRQADEGRARTRAMFATFNARSEAAAAPAAPGVAAAADAPAAVPVAEAATLATAVGVLGEYLADEWTAAVAAELGVPMAAAMPHAARRGPAGAGAARAPLTASPPCGVAPAGSIDDSDIAAAEAAGADADAGKAPPVDKAAQWNAAGLDDPSTLISRYVRPAAAGAGAGAAGGKAAAAKKPATLAQKKLAAISVKGMKPMTSFFGKPPAS